MYFLPAIDILGGKVVRLAEGDYSKVTTYNYDPVAQAQQLEEAGAKWLHVVDLDGAKMGTPANAAAVRAILQNTSLKVEVGGGIRDIDAVRRLADVGVTRVVLGTALVKDPDFAQAAREEFGPDMLAAGIDARDGIVQVEGWVQGASVSALELASRMAGIGYEHLIYTDIARDGMQTGIAPAAYVEMSQAFGNPVIASGGIASLDDIVELLHVSDAIEGVIAGRAIYEGNFSVAAAVAACEQTAVFDQSFAEGLEVPLNSKDLQ
jgi:phosphoribosylformimino-5-aminoimidazole carboxamide ribotide isomerase